MARSIYRFPQEGWSKSQGCFSVSISRGVSLSQEVMTWKLPNPVRVLVTPQGRITLSAVQANKPLRRRRSVYMAATARTAASAGRLRAEAETLLLLSYQEEKSGQCQPWVCSMEMTAAGNLPAVLDHKPCRVRPQTP